MRVVSRPTSGQANGIVKNEAPSRGKDERGSTCDIDIDGDAVDNMNENCLFGVFRMNRSDVFGD